VKLDGDWMASLTDPEAAKAALPAAQKVAALLDAAEVGLQTARPYVVGGKDADAAAVKRQLTAVLGTVEQALELLAEFGKSPPREALEAVGYLHGFLLGGAS
jgi:hypothetical protein